MSTIELKKNEDSAAGLGFAVAAYGLWGFLPLYMKAMAHIGPVEVVAHRKWNAQMMMCRR